MLPEPFELLELKDKESVTVQPVNFKLGKMIIHPTFAGAPKEKEITAIRISLLVGISPGKMPYLDLTAGTLVAQLAPLLPEVVSKKRSVKISAVGSGPSKRYTVEVL